MDAAVAAAAAATPLGALATAAAGNGGPLSALTTAAAGKGDPLGTLGALTTAATGNGGPLGALGSLGALATTAAAATPLGVVASTAAAAAAGKGGPLGSLGPLATPATGDAALNNTSIMVTGHNFGDAGDAGNSVTKQNLSKWQMFCNIFISFIEYCIINIFAPPELVNKKNSRILLNVIMLYAINYIYKYDVDKPNYEILKEIRDYLKIYKEFLLDKTLTLSKDYLDIVHDTVEDIKLIGERDFLKQQDNDKMDNERKIADNDLTFNYIKLIVDNSSGLSGGLFTTITSAIANIWKVMMIWTKPFAGLVILVAFIAFIILVFFGEDDTSPENSGGVGTGSLVGPGNFNFFSKNMQGSGGANNNTDIISVLQRLPQNIYSFFDKLSAAYTRFSNYANSSSDFINSLSDTTPIIEARTEKPNNTEGLYDNIYTFDYKYIYDISNDRAQIRDIIVDGAGKISQINLGSKGRYLSAPRIIISKPSESGSIKAEAKAELKLIAGTTPQLYEIDRIIIITGGSKYKPVDNKLIKIEDPSHIIDSKNSTDDTLVYNIKMPKKSDNPNISEYYGISHDYKFDEGGEKKDEYIYAPKCGTDNDYVYDDCTVKIKVCGEATKEDTSDYKNIII
jgi:hypothetical protein